MSYRVLTCITLATILALNAAGQDSFPVDNLTTYGIKAWKESGEPIRPGKPGEAPFWNGHSKRFIFAPAFDFKKIDGAAKYKFELTSEKTSKSLSFEAEVPYAALSAVWPKVPVGFVNIKVTGLNAGDQEIGIAGEQRTWRAAPFNGPYHEPPEMPLDESATLALKNLLHKDYVNYWLDHQKPDPDYKLYRYPSKIHGALVIGAVTQARLTSGTEEAERSVKLARTIADYLLSIRFPKGTAWEYAVPTYHGIHIKNDKPQRSHMKTTVHLSTMSVDAGNAFLDLYDLTGDKKYFEAAKLIAETLKKNQDSKGTWVLFADYTTGKSVTILDAIPTAMINYFDRLRSQYKVEGLDEATKRALDYVMKNPVKTFAWNGQFEDVVPREFYVNHSREQACELAMYLYRNNGDKKLAEELVRFAEDQFVIWEQPIPKKPKKNQSKGFDSSTWITPSVQEQYVFWNPVGRAAGIMIDTYWEAYKATGDDLYKAKAKSIANSFPEMQKQHDGDYYTFFTGDYPMNFWLNSVVYPAKVLMNLDRNLEKK